MIVIFISIYHQYIVHILTLHCIDILVSSSNNYSMHNCNPVNGPIAVCQTNCDGNEKKLSSCDLRHTCPSSDKYNYNYDYEYYRNTPCTHDNDVILHCCKLSMLMLIYCMYKGTFQIPKLIGSLLTILNTYLYNYIIDIYSTTFTPYFKGKRRCINAI